MPFAASWILLGQCATDGGSSTAPRPPNGATAVGRGRDGECVRGTGMEQVFELRNNSPCGCLRDRLLRRAAVVEAPGWQSLEC